LGGYLVKIVMTLPYQSAILLEGFWPSNNWKSNYSRASLSTTIVGIDPKDPIQHFYCGPKKMRPSTVYTLVRNLNDGDFVFIRPHDLGLFLFGLEECKVMRRVHFSKW
jgi:hypothetical protein